MEAVAAAASIAGIITVVGQSIDGLIKFSDFFSDISSASKTISRLLNDINSLIQVLEDIGNVLEQAQARRSGRNLASLDIKLEDCAKDVQVWLATARLLRPGGSDSGGKAWLRKFRLAVNNTAIQTIREEIGRHKQTLCLSLAVFGRTIDIDTSTQVHQMGGRFSEALSTSLSVHGAHEEALRRIEHYSMTSMHSSAHSIRSMDSIRTELRTELSRLEAKITSANNTYPTGSETAEPLTESSSSGAQEHFSAVVEEGNKGPHPSALGPLPRNGEESSVIKDSGIRLASKRESWNEARNGLTSSTRSQQTRRRDVKDRIETDFHLPSMDEREKESLKGEINKVSDLYAAQFSKKLELRPSKRPETEYDGAAIHHALRQSLASIYPPEVVNYISLRQVTVFCEDHMDFLDRRPSVHISVVGKMKEESYVDSGTRTAARPSMVELRARIVELQKAIKVSREQCFQAGYTLSELDKFFSPAGSGSYLPADRLPRKPEFASGDDSSSIYSEDFHSPAE